MRWWSSLIDWNFPMFLPEPGKLADFTIIEGDPLADISVTKNVRMVIKDGQIMDASCDPHWVNPITFCAVCPKGWPGQASS